MSRQKGNRNRRLVQRWLESKGYITANVEKTGRYQTERDLFAKSQDGEFTDKGFDIVAISRGSIILCQVKTNNPPTTKWYKKFAEKYADGYLEVLVATKEDYYGLRLQWYEPDGSVIEGYVTKKELRNG